MIAPQIQKTFAYQYVAEAPCVSKNYWVFHFFAAVLPRPGVALAKASRDWEADSGRHHENVRRFSENFTIHDAQGVALTLRRTGFTNMAESTAWRKDIELFAGLFKATSKIPCATTR